MGKKPNPDVQLLLSTRNPGNSRPSRPLGKTLARVRRSCSLPLNEEALQVVKFLPVESQLCSFIQSLSDLGVDHLFMLFSIPETFSP